jgi:RNA recognition motif-containing protein
MFIHLYVYDFVGAKKGFAYVDIYKISDAKKIFENMHGSEILGRAVNIDDATRK